MNAKLELKARSFTKVEIVPAQPFPLSILPLILCILFLYHVWMEVIISIIPVPDAIQAAINQRLPHYPALPLLLFIGILWSVLSEVLFRGIILKGLLRKYTPFQAILWSSIFFSVSLLNPYNALCVFLLGLFCGWLFYRTHSLLPSILVQILALLPGAIYISWAKPGHFEQLLIWKNLIGNQVIYYSLGLVSVLLTIFLLWWLKKLFDQKQGVAFFTTE
jgi:membrane protease YdiL (CAAX protease family)